MSNDTLTKSVQAFAAWYKLVRLVFLLQVTAFVLTLAFAAFVLADKLVYTGADYAVVGLSLAAAGLLFLLVAYLTMRRRLPEVTYLIDRHAGLKNLVSSGLAAAGQAEPVAQAVVARATDALRRQDLPKTLPLRWHWTGRFSLAPVLLAGGLFFLPNQDLLRRQAHRDEQRHEAARREQGAKILQDKLVKLEQLNRQVSQMDGKNITEDLKKLEQELRAAAGKKEALTSLSSLENRYRRELDKQRNFEAATKSLDTRLNSRDLNAKTADELRKLLDNLKRDNLAQAANNMRELAQQLGSNELSEKEKEALARELSQVLQQFAGDPQADELSKLLGQMQAQPLNQQTASAPNNPASAAAAANPKQPQQNPNRQNNPNQPNQNANQQNANQQNANQQNANQQCNSGSCQNPGGNSPGQGGNPQAQQQAVGQLQQLAESMEQMDALRQMKEGLDNARREMTGDQFAGFDAKNVEEYLRQEQGNGACLGMPGEGQGEGPGGKGNGPGTGGEGRGRGGRPPEKMTATGLEDKLTQSKVGKGAIISQRWVQGVPDKGDAVNDYTSAVRAARDQALDSLAKTRVPREYEEQVKRYFSALEPEKGKERQE